MNRAIYLTCCRVSGLALLATLQSGCCSRLRSEAPGRVGAEAPAVAGELLRDQAWNQLLGIATGTCGRVGEPQSLTVRRAIASLEGQEWAPCHIANALDDSPILLLFERPTEAAYCVAPECRLSLAARAGVMIRYGLPLPGTLQTVETMYSNKDSRIFKLTYTSARVCLSRFCVFLAIVTAGDYLYPAIVRIEDGDGILVGLGYKPLGHGTTTYPVPGSEGFASGEMGEHLASTNRCEVLVGINQFADAVFAAEPARVDEVSKCRRLLTDQVLNRWRQDRWISEAARSVLAGTFHYSDYISQKCPNQTW